MTGPWGRGLWSIFHRDSRRTESLFVAIIVRYAFCVENNSIHVESMNNVVYCIMDTLWCLGNHDLVGRIICGLFAGTFDTGIIEKLRILV